MEAFKKKLSTQTSQQPSLSKMNRSVAFCVNVATLDYQKEVDLKTPKKKCIYPMETK